MNSFADYVVNGHFGHLSLGMSREAVLEALGEPKDWAGRGHPGDFFASWCASYEEARVWKYYEECAGIGFSEGGRANCVIIYTKEAGRCPELFQDWPTMCGLRIGDWVAALKANNIAFRQSPPDPLSYLHWLIASETCEVHGYAPGVPIMSQQIEIIIKFSSVEVMKRSHRYLKPP